jgi:hypothetical protein
MIVMHITILLLLTHRAPFCHSMQNNNKRDFVEHVAEIGWGKTNK